MSAHSGGGEIVSNYHKDVGGGLYQILVLVLCHSAVGLAVLLIWSRWLSLSLSLSFSLFPSL